MTLPLWSAVPVLALVALAAWSDVRTRKIPNALTGSAALLAVLAHLMLGGRTDAMFALAGLAVAGAVLLPGWLLGWMGAGDVKLMAAAGAWLGFEQGVLAVLAACIAGGLIAAVQAARRGVLMQAMTSAAWLGAWTVSGAVRGGAPPPVTSGVRFPFALAAVAGVIFALWVRP